MAKGRMIVKEFSYDEKIWEMISERAALHYAACFAHIETDGTLPRKAATIRLMCFPSSKASSQDTEGFILEWINAKLCQEKEGRLFFSDFEKSNENLDYFRVKKWREKKQKKRLIRNDTNDNARYVEEKRSEEKRSEVNNNKQQHTTPKGVASPVLNRKLKHETEALRAVVSHYLKASGKGNSDIAKNPEHGGWAGWMKEADTLLGHFRGRVDLAVECIDYYATKWKNIDWTLRGIERNAMEWLASMQSKVNQ